MKFNVLGFDQKKASDLELCVADLLILRWFLDFDRSKKMRSRVINSKKYYLVDYDGIIKDLPLLEIKTTKGISKHFMRLVDKNIFEKTIKHKNCCGTQTYYCPTDLLYEIEYKKEQKNNPQPPKQPSDGTESTCQNDVKSINSSPTEDGSSSAKNCGASSQNDSSSHLNSSTGPFHQNSSTNPSSKEQEPPIETSKSVEEPSFFKAIIRSVFKDEYPFDDSFEQQVKEKVEAQNWNKDYMQKCLSNIFSMTEKANPKKSFPGYFRTLALSNSVLDSYDRNSKESSPQTKEAPEPMYCPNCHKRLYRLDYSQSYCQKCGMNIADMDFVKNKDKIHSKENKE